MPFEKYPMPGSLVKPEELQGKDDWLDPLFVAPTAPHARSIVILHGRGDNAFNFGVGLMTTQLPETGLTLPQMFSDTKFIFPSAKMRRAQAFNRAKFPQWFDIYSLEDPDERQDLQREGLHDTAVFVHQILRQEGEAVGLENVLLGGLSQGCASGLHILMSLEAGPEQRLGGFFGMSGWLPFAIQLEAIAENKELTGGLFEATSGGESAVQQHAREDPFERDKADGEGTKSIRSQAWEYVRQHVLNFSDSHIADESSSPPIFLGHGAVDEKVAVKLGEDAARIMAKLGWQVTWKSYAELPHWYSPEELEDIATFVQNLKLTKKSD